MSGWHREEDGRLVRMPEQDSSPERRPSPEVHRSLRSTSSEARRSRRLARVAAARASAGLTSPEVALGDPAVPSSLEVACGKRELALVAVDSSPRAWFPTADAGVRVAPHRPGLPVQRVLALTGYELSGHDDDDDDDPSSSSSSSSCPDIF